MAQVAGGLLGTGEFLIVLLFMFLVGARLKSNILKKQEQDMAQQQQRKQQKSKPEPVADDNDNGHKEFSDSVESWWN
jgi:predicted metalloprotease